MRLESIEVSNVLGISNASIDTVGDVTMVCGPNGAGKSSLIEAIRMVIDGQAIRVSKKKDYESMVHGDNESGFIKIGFDGEIRTVNIPSGKGMKALGGEYMPYVTNPSLFASISAQDRRGILFGVMGVRHTIEDIRERLASRGHHDSLIKEIMPFARAGFADAAKEAASRATEQKGVWKNLTGGETWGEVKGREWVSKSTIHVSQADIETAITDLEKLDAEIESETIAYGAASAARNALKEYAERIDLLKKRAANKDRIQQKLDKDREELDAWKVKLETRREQAGIKPAVSPKPIPCPHCGGLVESKAGALVVYQETEPLTHYDHDATSDIPQYENAVRTLENSVRNSERDLSAAFAAETELESTGEPPAVPDIDAITNRLQAMKLSRTNMRSELQRMKDAEKAEREADSKTASAMKAHESVMAWNAIAESLSPNGIQADMLSESITPFNSTLERHAKASGWLTPVITSDMAIKTSNGRAYNLLSESERWRVDAILAAAISEHSGINFLIFDRFDVLDIQNRLNLIVWLKGEVDSGRVDSAIIAGTLKAIPTGLPRNINVIWVESGAATAQIMEKAA